MVTIYLDVLIVTNVYVNYFLIRSTAKLTHSAVKLWRCIIGSFIASLFSIIIIFPEFSGFALTVIKLFVSVLIIVISFSELTVKRTIKLTVIFYIINFLYAGFMDLIFKKAHSSIVVVNNSAVYLDIPIIFLVVSTIGAYIIISVFSYIFEKNFKLTNSYKVLVEMLGHQYLFNAVCDTGNNLTDAFTNRPVVVCNSKEMYETINIDFNLENIESQYINLVEKTKGMRLITYNTIQGSGVIPILRPEKIYIKDEKNKIKPIDAYVGIIFNKGRREEAVFNPSILI